MNFATIPQYSQTENAQSRLGIEIQRFCCATFLPVEDHWASSSGSHLSSVRLIGSTFVLHGWAVVRGAVT